MPVYTNAPGIADLSPLDWRRDDEVLEWTGAQHARRRAPSDFLYNAGAGSCDVRNSRTQVLRLLDDCGKPDARFEFLAHDDPRKDGAQMHGLAYLLAALVAAGVAADIFMPVHESGPARRGELEISAGAASNSVNVWMLPPDAPTVVDEDVAQPPATATDIGNSAAPKAPSETAEAQTAWQTDVHPEPAARNTPGNAPIDAVRNGKHGE